MAEAWPDVAGRIRNGIHIMPIRIYYEDTDAGGVVYHASFVRFAERGRTDFLRLLGTDARRLIDGSDSREPAAFVVRRAETDDALRDAAYRNRIGSVRARALGGLDQPLRQRRERRLIEQVGGCAGSLRKRRRAGW